MEDRDLMENELLVIKGVCDLYLHGVIESSLNIQNKIYNLMAEKGWYKTDTAEQQKIDTAKQKFSNACC